MLLYSSKDKSTTRFHYRTPEHLFFIPNLGHFVVDLVFNSIYFSEPQTAPLNTR